MLLSDVELQTYLRDGYLLCKDRFSPDEIEALRAELPSIFAEDSPRRIREDGGAAVRSVYGCHASNVLMGRLARQGRVICPAAQILGSDVYVYQFKINVKSAFSGDIWDWHQDYIFWRNEDGMKAPRVTNLILFLDEVNEFNGPIFLIPGSQREGVIEVGAREELPDRKPAGPAWTSNLVAALKYTIPAGTVSALAARYGMAAPKGPAGTLMLMDSNIVHSSPNNISPYGRSLIIITLNSVANAPSAVSDPRPEFLASRRNTPVIPLRESLLKGQTAAADMPASIGN